MGTGSRENAEEKFRVKATETEFNVALIPLGGYVKWPVPLMKV